MAKLVRDGMELGDADDQVGPDRYPDQRPLGQHEPSRGTHVCYATADALACDLRVYP